jgi:hypothetical protein
MRTVLEWIVGNLVLFGSAAAGLGVLAVLFRAVERLSAPDLLLPWLKMFAILGGLGTTAALLWIAYTLLNRFYR